MGVPRKCPDRIVFVNDHREDIVADFDGNEFFVVFLVPASEFVCGDFTTQQSDHVG